MHGARSASLTLDLVIVVLLFVLSVFAAAYQPASSATDPAPSQQYRHDVMTEQVDDHVGGDAAH